MRHLLSTLLFCSFCLSHAQETQQATFDGAYNVYAVDSLGVVLLDRRMLQLSNGDLALEYIGLDDKLKQKWKNLFPFSKGMSPVFQEVSPKGIFLLFADKSGRNYELIKANTDYGDYERFQYSFSDRVQIREIENHYDQVWVAGTIGNNPVIFTLRPDNTVETVPTGFPGTIKYTGRLHFDIVTKGLNFVILSEDKGKQTVVWRSIGLKGNILQNESLLSTSKRQIKTIEATYTGKSAFLTGTYTMSNRDRLIGLFWAKINADQKVLKFNEFKTIQGVVNYKKSEDVMNQGFDDAKNNRFKMSNMSVFVDGLSVNKDGVLSIALEVYRPEFRSRGALEKEFIARDRSAQIDQNVYGRQDAIGTPLGVEARMERASATDQLQMRFMDQSLSKAVNQGVSYHHTTYVEVSSDLELINSQGLAFDMLDFGGLTRTAHFANNQFRYAFQNKYQAFDIVGQAFESLDFPEGMSLLNWTEERLLGVMYNQETNQLTLSINSLN